MSQTPGTKNIVISGTSFWNPGDDFVRDGVIAILRNLFSGLSPNFFFYNFNADFPSHEKFAGIANTIACGDLRECGDHMDAVVIAGLSAGCEIRDLYNWIIDAGLQDRVYLIGAGYENDYVANHISREPEATIFRHARIITGRTARRPAFIDDLGLPYHHVPCPAILSVKGTKSIGEGQKIRKIGFSVQLPHEQGIVNQCCSDSNYRLSLEMLLHLAGSHEVEVIAHHKSEYYHFLKLLAGTRIAVHFSSFYHDLHDIYRSLDLVVTTRLHASLFANGHGIPGIIINDTDRHTHCLEGFPHSVCVNSRESFDAAFRAISHADLCAIAIEAESFKSQLMQTYVALLEPAFKKPRVSGERAIVEPSDPYWFDSEKNEQKLVRRHVRKGMTVFDVGANIGKYTKLFSFLTGDEGVVFAFEPSEGAYRKLREGVQGMGATNVTCLRKAAFSENATLQFNEFPERYSSWNSLGRPAMEDPEEPSRLVPLMRSVNVEAVTIDSFCEEWGIDTIDYLKLDVEGAEIFALQGAERLLERKAIRLLQFEISQKMLEGLGTKAGEVFNYLASKGYACHTITEDGELGETVTDSDAFYENYIAIPRISTDPSCAEIVEIPIGSPLTWFQISGLSEPRFYAGDLPCLPQYNGWIGLSLNRSDAHHILHDITTPFPLPDNSINSFQAEDVFEHINLDLLPAVIDEIFRILKPGGLFRLSLPDYGCDVLRARSIKDASGTITFDPYGGGTPDEPGHVWFPRVNLVKALLDQSAFILQGTIDYLHYWDTDISWVVKPIDYTNGHIQRTPDFDPRVKEPYRPMSIVVNLVKGNMPGQTQYSIETLPRVSFVMIVLNGMPFIEYALKAIYEEAHEIIIVEGAVEKCMFAANGDGRSTDGTVECIRSFPDPYGKIRLIQGRWPEKCEMQNAALAHVTGSYVWLVDSDEIYRHDDIRKVRAMLAADPAITQMNFIPDNFWKGFDFLFVHPSFFEASCHYRRLFKFVPGARFTSHRPPTMVWPGADRSTEQMKPVDGSTTRQMGIYPYHYSYVLESQVQQKIELYRRYGWGEGWEIDLELWYRDCFLKWTPDNRESIEKIHPVWTGGKNSHTMRFQGKHPLVMNDLIVSFNRKGGTGILSEEAIMPIIGCNHYLKQALDSWQHIELDAPLQSRYQTIKECITTGKPFWNIHVALAFITEKLQPESYLEVGVRTGGSMVQVLGAAHPENVVAMDLWGGNYASFPNSLEYTRKQLQAFQVGKERSYNIEFIKGNSHVELKNLIRQGRTFDLITIDGDHSLEGAREDIEDALQILSERGALIFDDIIHVSFKFLLDLAYEIKERHPNLTLLLNTTQDNGCAIFLKNISWEYLSRPVKTGAKGIKVAGEVSCPHDLTAVDGESEFARAIKELFTSIRPTRIIETGTYLGEGTTRVITSTLQELGLNDTVFCSIECNPDNYRQALANLMHRNLSDRVTVLHGLSVPRSKLPTIHEIEESCVNNIEFDYIFVDHQEQQRALLYYKETDFAGVEDDMLGKALEIYGESPDFVLLDSGGHMGNVEFNYLISRLKGSCHLALDDIFHIKHHKSFRQIQEDPRFTIIKISDEKFGFCIAKFSPCDSMPAATTNQILWVRTDSIGDAVLASSMLPHIRDAYQNAHISVLCQEHIAELYEACPYIDEIITFNLKKAEADYTYRDKIVESLRERHFDLALNSVYSRNGLSDHFVMASEIVESIGHQGDLSNLTGKQRETNNANYSRLLPSEGAWKPELQRHRDFLAGLDIRVAELNPSVWITPDDFSFAEEFFHANQLDPKRTVALFSGAQHSLRHYLGYGQALSELCIQRGFTVIALGAAEDADLNRKNLADLSVKTMDLSGKTTLRQTAALLSRCCLAIGAETGLAHMACAVDVPNVILLGGGHAGRFIPYSRLTTAVSLPLACFGCNWHCKFVTTYCVRSIDPVSLGKACHIALDTPTDRARVIVQTAATGTIPDDFPMYTEISRFIDQSLADIITLTGDSSMQNTVTNTTDQQQSVKINNRLQEGEEYFSRGDFDSAIDCFNRIVHRYPECSAPAHSNLGVIYWQRGETQISLEHLSSALKLDPSYRPAVTNSIAVLEQLGAFSAATRICHDFLELHPDDHDLQNKMQELGASGFHQLEENWEKFAQTDPMWAILTDPAKKGNKWEPGEFFATGIKDIQGLFNYLKGIDISPSLDSALDFGCGVGRITQALAMRFTTATGIDIAPSMIREAKRHNRFDVNCRYLLNQRNDLEMFADGTFDFIYSVITLQHIRPIYIKNYLVEFMRVLKPNGILVFQLPSRLYGIPTPQQEIDYATEPTSKEPRMEMHGIPKEEVIEFIGEHGGKAVDIIPDRSLEPAWESYRYCVIKYGS